MRVVLVGADLEENLGVGIIAACAERAGHRVEVVPFDRAAQLRGVIDAVLGRRPDVVGLSAQFQHRAHDFLTLARSLRARGFQGHVTAGGQFPTMAFREVLASGNGVDSVVMYEGEETFVDLLDALERGGRLEDVPGLALPGRGLPHRTTHRALVAELDEVPFAKRYRAHARHLGIPFVPIMGGRGCWGSCTYCSITTFYRDARAHGGGQTLRHRSPENLAREMALLAHAAGGRALFCFHDDNFLMPRPRDSVARVRAIRAGLDDYGVGRVAFIGKCRPDSVTPELARDLAALGVIRLYVGVENAAQHGADALGRRTQTSHVRDALRAAREAGIFVCYNLLLFEPTSTLDDVRENVRFIREHADHPVNFCRAEPYHGTPLHLSLAEKHALGGSYLGWDYRVADDRTELLFRICSAAFRERNFACDGIGNRYMSLGYSAKILQFFYAGPRADALAARARDLTRGIACETADLIEEALELAASVDLADHDRIARATALLGLKIAAMDRVWHRAIDELQFDMSRYAESFAAPAPSRAPSKLLAMVQHAAFASALSVWATGCGGKTTETVDPVPPDTGMKDTSDVVDPVPPDSAFDWGPVDALPPDSGYDFGPADPPPPDTGFDWGPVDALPPDSGYDSSVGDSDADVKFGLIDQWQDTTPRRAERTRDLPLWAPPQVTLHAERDGDRVTVRLRGGPVAISTRWQADGEVAGEGRAIEWTPAGADDRLACAVRTTGGVAVLAIRARDVT